ncbi:MAG TPA: MBL fold metallo-hydrolase [Chloroflexota bacterium]|nr:MBL fold metallo-hydrolase [Chloroflexota bacterium]
MGEAQTLHRTPSPAARAAAAPLPVRAPAGAPRLVFLGTGGGAHAERCHVAIAIEVGPRRVLLLDTAGGFELLRQLKLAGIELSAVRHIFLSHRHSDHIGGLEPLLLHIGLQAMRARCRGRDVSVYGHAVVLEAARTIIDAMASAAPTFLAKVDARLRWNALGAGATVDLWPGVRLTTFAADHVPADGTAFGCVVEVARAGHRQRIVYSGDTRPTPELRAAARGADILLHEAGGIDEDAELMHVAGHSSAGEAARLAAEAGVGCLVLCHLPHEEIVPQLIAEARRYYEGPVIVPRDLDTLPLTSA